MTEADCLGQIPGSRTTWPDKESTLRPWRPIATSARRLDGETGPGDLWDVLDDPLPQLDAVSRYAAVTSELLSGMATSLEATPGTGEVDTDALIEEFRNLAQLLDQASQGATMMPASLSLAARAEALLNRLAQVEAQEADQQARLEIERARVRASNSREGLENALSVIPVLAESGVHPVIPASPAIDLAGARRALRATATSVVGAPVGEIASRVRSNSVNTALENADRFTRNLVSALNRSVEKKRQEILPPEIDRPIIAYPGASDALAVRLRRLQTLLQRKVDGLSPSDLAKRLQELVSAAESWTTDRPRLGRGPRPPAPGGPGIPA